MGIHVASRIHHRLAQTLVDVPLLGHDDSTYEVGMTVDELGHGVKHHVGTQLQWPLQVGAGEGIVHHHQATIAWAMAEACSMYVTCIVGLAGVSR